MTLVEKWYAEDKHVCLFCRSSNVEIMDVKINNTPLYNFDDLCLFYGPFLLAINLQKDNDITLLNIGGSKKIEVNFVRGALLSLIETIRNRTDNLFHTKSNGHFFICISGGTNIHNSNEEINIQKLRHAGFSKNEILDNITSFAFKNSIAL